MVRVGCVSDQGESTLEDQATQTDDEAEDDPPFKLRRPTNFKNGRNFKTFELFLIPVRKLIVYYKLI